MQFSTQVSIYNKCIVIGKNGKEKHVLVLDAKFGDCVTPSLLELILKSFKIEENDKVLTIYGIKKDTSYLSIHVEPFYLDLSRFFRAWVDKSFVEKLKSDGFSELLYRKQSTVLSILVDIASGINHLISQKKRVRVDPANIFISIVPESQKIIAKVGRCLVSEIAGRKGFDMIMSECSLCYRPPEFTKQKAVMSDYTESEKNAMVVWSFGILAFQLLIGDFPFMWRNPSLKDWKSNVREIDGFIAFMLDGGDNAFCSLPSEIIDLLVGCLNFNPEKRLKFEEICPILKKALVNCI